jgi:hypothetical protein
VQLTSLIGKEAGTAATGVTCDTVTAVSGLLAHLCAAVPLSSYPSALQQVRRWPVAVLFCLASFILYHKLCAAQQAVCGTEEMQWVVTSSS